MKVIEELKKNEREYVTPSCKMMAIDESSLLVGTQTAPDPLGPPSGETTDPNTAKQGKVTVWED